MDTSLSALSATLSAGSILTESGDLAKYERDWTGQYAGKAAAVFRPTSTTEVAAILAAANAAGTPVIPMGGNTGTSGAAVPDQSGDAIILSLERMNQIREISPSAKTMTVEAGCVLANLQDAAEEQGLFLPIDLGARGSCMIGGNLSTNAGGNNVVRYGNTRELCLGLEVALPDGRVMDVLSGLRKDNTGYDLRDLFIGAEGTLGVITAATMKLFPLPKARATAFAAVPDIATALALLNRMQAETGGAVEAFEMMPVEVMRLLAKHVPQRKQPFPEPPDLSILMEIAATSDAEAQPGPDGQLPIIAKLETLLAAGFESGQISDAVLATSEAQRKEFWELRDSCLEAAIAAGPRIGFDISLPLDRVHDFVAEMRATAQRILPGVTVSALGHLGDGNLHYGIMPEAVELEQFRAKGAEIKTTVLDSVAEYRGSFSAEHGIGTSKLDEMATYKDPVALAVMRDIKSVLDPNGIMNPGKVLPNC